MKTEDQVKYLSVHLGQDIEIISLDFSTEGVPDIIIDVLQKVSINGCISGKNYTPEITDTRLLLTPLDQITDEDAIEVAKILTETTKVSEDVFYDTNRKCTMVLFNGLNVSFYRDGSLLISDEDMYEYEEMLSLRYLKAYQYLQSKGYALLWMQYSVHQLIEEGVLRLRTK